jgi:hypothetical protein
MSQNNQDNSEVLIVALLIFFVAAYFIYYFFSEYFIEGWFYLRWVFIAPLHFVPDIVFNTVYSWGNFFSSIPIAQLAEIHGQHFINNNSELYISDAGFRTDVNRLFIIIYSPFIFLYALKIFITIFNKKSLNIPLDLKKFREQESELWPTIKPAIYQSKKVIFAIDEGDWAMSTRPESYCFKNGFMERYKDDDDNERFYLKYDVAYDFFINQLGKRWKGIESLKVEEKYLLIILLTKINRETAKAEYLLNLFGNYYTSEKGLKVYLKKRKLLKIINKEMNSILNTLGHNSDIIPKAKQKHYYKLTIFAYLLKEARNDGVLAAGQFLWLKPLNRDLFYMMSTVGRRVPFFDSAGGWSHYIYEQAINHFSSMPKVDSAVRALDDYFEMRYDEYDPISKNNEK